ncbi:helix-turn-helix domain-containing protein [Chromobacterium haemolyticum]|uniref:helix-turn-helix domain-containing protein n=1 Tax=Chromobacterium TaxID=535 RepID=UPI004055A366
MGILHGMTAKRSNTPTARPAPISIALGKRIKECRHAVDKSQETLAFEAQVDRTYISSIERGAANPSIETLADICHAIGISLAELFAPMTDIPPAPSGDRRVNAATPPEIKRRRLR